MLVGRVNGNRRQTSLGNTQAGIDFGGLCLFQRCSGEWDASDLKVWPPRFLGGIMSVFDLSPSVGGPLKVTGSNP